MTMGFSKQAEARAPAQPTTASLTGRARDLPSAISAALPSRLAKELLLSKEPVKSLDLGDALTPAGDGSRWVSRINATG